MKVILLFTACLAFWQGVHSCTVIAAGRKATADGSVLLSHTDCGPNSRIQVVPGRVHKPGEMAPVYWGIQDATRPLGDWGEVLGRIPQVARTYTYFHSAYPHLNEFQLGIAESTTSQRPELAVEKGQGEQIMTIEQAQAFALQRCKKAREAVQVLGSLLETWGFLPSSGDGSEVLVVGDPLEAWVFEVFSVGPGWKKASGRPGAIWAAQRLGDDQALMVPNWSVIKEIRPGDRDHFMVSANWMSEAVERGWYDPAGGKPFVWQEIYAPLPVEFATSRFWLFHRTFAPSAGPWPDRGYSPARPYSGISPYYQVVEPLSIYPFSVRPEKKISLADVIAFQRSVFEGTVYDMSNDPAWLVPDGKGGAIRSPLATPFPGRDLRALLRLTYRRPVARHRGHYGMVLQLRAWLPDAIGGVYWIFLDNPAISPYVPIWAGNTTVAPSYQEYDANAFSETSARWAIDFVDNLANLRFQEAIADVRAAREPFEKEIFSTQAETEAKALELYRRSPDKARRFLTGRSVELMSRVVPLYARLRGTLISKYTNNRE